MKTRGTVLFSARAECNLHLRPMKVRKLTYKWLSKWKLLLTILGCILLVLPCLFEIVRADTGWTTTKVVSYDSWLDSYDPSLDVDLDGMIHITWTDLSNILDSGYEADIYYWNKSRGVDWSETPFPVRLISTESTTEHDPLQYGSGRPFLSVSPKYTYGYSVYIAWEDFSRLPDSGDSAESLYNPYQDVFLKSIWRTRQGDYWTTTMLVSESNDFDNWQPSIDVSPDGVAHIAWTAGGDIHYRNLRFGAGFSEVEFMDTAYAQTPSLRVGPDGTVHIVWQDSTDYGGSGNDINIFYRRYEPDGGWTTTEVVSTESTVYSSKPSLAVGHDGKVHIAWYDMLNGVTNVFYRRYEPDGGWTTTEEVSTGIEPSLDVGSDGKVHIAWADMTDYGGSGNDIDIFYRRYEPDGGWTTTEVVSTESTDRSTNPSLAVGPDRTVHIAWEDKTNLDNSVSFPDDSDIFYKSYEPPEASFYWPSETDRHLIAMALYSSPPIFGMEPVIVDLETEIYNWPTMWHEIYPTTDHWELRNWEDSDLDGKVSDFDHIEMYNVDSGDEQLFIVKRATVALFWLWWDETTGWGGDAPPGFEPYYPCVGEFTYWPLPEEPYADQNGVLPPPLTSRWQMISPSWNRIFEITDWEDSIWVDYGTFSPGDEFDITFLDDGTGPWHAYLDGFATVLVLTETERSSAIYPGWYGVIKAIAIIEAIVIGVLLLILVKKWGGPWNPPKTNQTIPKKDLMTRSCLVLFAL